MNMSWTRKKSATFRSLFPARCGILAAVSNTFTLPLEPAQREALRDVLSAENYVPRTVPYAVLAADAPSWGCNVALYASGKCVVQGKGAREFVEHVLEPLVLRRIVLDPAGDGLAQPPLTDEALSPHVGVDESGKGDFFGPLIVAAVYTDPDLGPKLREAGARDSKTIASDRQALETAARIRAVLGPGRFAVVRIGCGAYNRLYAKMRSLNRMLAWAHARSIEDVLATVPDCPMAISDQFGDEGAVRRALLARGRGIELRSRTKAESDVAVGAASILAREGFLLALRELRERYGGDFPKGASPQVRAAAETLVRAHGPAVLVETAKCHFRTLDQVLAATGHSREELPPEGRVLSVPPAVFRHRPSPAP